MEILCGSGLAVGSTVKRKRSRVSHKPRANLDAMFQSYFCLPSYVEPYGKHEENENQRDTMVASDGSGAENKLKKLKLKLGGVTHTIHTRVQIEISSTYGSYVANLSSSSYGLKSQDDAAENHACSSNKRKGRRDQDQFQKLASTAGFTAENRSCRGKTPGESLTGNQELVHKSKSIPRRLVLDVGFIDEETEDAELKFLERLNASNDAVSCNKDSQGTRIVHGTFKVSERSQIDGLNNFGTIGSSKDGKKKLKPEKKMSIKAVWKKKVQLQMTSLYLR